MKQIKGFSATYAVINTAEYNNDGKWQIVTAEQGELASLGFDAEDVERIGELGIGDALRDFVYNGVIVIRIA